MIKKLKELHVLHKWTKWKAGPIKYMGYPWTTPGKWVETQTEYKKECTVCGLVRSRTVVGA